MGIDSETQRVIEKVQKEVEENKKREQVQQNQKGLDDKFLEIKVPEVKVPEKSQEKLFDKLITLTSSFFKLSKSLV